MDKRKNGEDSAKRAEKPVVSDMGVMSEMQKMPIHQLPQMQPVTDMGPQIQQMPDLMPQMQQMPMMQMPDMMQMPMMQMPAMGAYMPMICCPVLMNKQCPMLPGQMGMHDPVMGNPCMGTSYMGNTYMGNPYMNSPYMPNPFMCNPGM